MDGDMIDLAFSKQRVMERKQWMRDGNRRVAEERAAEVEAAKLAASTQPAEVEEVVVEEDGGWKRRSIETFVQTDLVTHSLADLRRSVPSVIDGLKPSQRKVLHACFQKKLLPRPALFPLTQHHLRMKITTSLCPLDVR